MDDDTTPQHPGCEIQKLIAERGINEMSFRYGGVAVLALHRIIQGEADIPSDDPRFVNNLANVLRVEPRYLLELQARYNERLAEIDRAERARIAAEQDANRAERKTKQLESKQKARKRKYGTY